MAKYDYIRVVTDDVYDFMNTEYSTSELHDMLCLGSGADWMERLEEAADRESVTACVSGSYFGSEETARKALEGNGDLLVRAYSSAVAKGMLGIAKYGDPSNVPAEAADCMIREYVLHDAVVNAAQQIEEDMFCEWEDGE